ncbi:hypothetical protein BsWGS_05193 [Bradybaena similaris]
MDTLKLLLLAVLVAQCWAQGSPVELDDKFRETILNYHNTKRANETACQMNALAWSLKLERLAYEWISRCEYGHQYGDFGENIGRFSIKYDVMTLGLRGCSMWHEEISDYKPGQENCDPSCHYTQMVWADTLYIGCSVVECKKQKYKFLACFYWPPGNYEKEAPYKTECSSPCRKDQTLDNNLCYNKNYTPIVDDYETTADTTTPEPTTTTTTATTTTTTETTTTMATTTRATTPPPPPPTTMKTDDCADQGSDCERRVAKGNCKKPKVQTMCRKSCNLC